MAPDKKDVVPRRTPFRRAIMKRNEIRAALLLKEPERTLALGRITPYKGRGKGGKYRFIKRCESRTQNIPRNGGKRS